MMEAVRKWHGELVALGNIPAVIVIYLPRLFVSMLVVSVAQLCRLCAWLIDETSDVIRQPKVNKRILIVTDYLPPQTHGIAIRFQQYIQHMRKEGHEVHVFATTQRPELETSFDHPRLPSVVNPWNVKNRMAYNPGVRLAWTLGARQWDVVHVVFPSLIGAFVIAVCGWRRIPVYCSHHVDLDFYAVRYARFKPLRAFGLFSYDLLARWPATRGGTVNAAPTLKFLRAHMRCDPARERRIPTGVNVSTFTPHSAEHVAADRRTLIARLGSGVREDVKLWLMVQRLAPEKDTVLAFGALEAALARHSKAAGGSGADGAARNGKDGAPIHLVIAGDGPSMASLQAEAREKQLPVTFLGNTEHDLLPPLYRAADVFVTCSTSETYGLTVVEALASGTPVVMPHCEVFDELWDERLPSGWMYDPSASGPEALLAALTEASAPAAAKWLSENPVKISWEAASAELLEQYEEAISSNLPYRREKASGKVTIVHSAMAGTAFATLWWLTRIYARTLIRIFAKLMMINVVITN